MSEGGRGSYLEGNAYVLLPLAIGKSATVPGFYFYLFIYLFTKKKEEQILKTW